MKCFRDNMRRMPWANVQNIRRLLYGNGRLNNNIRCGRQSEVNWMNVLTEFMNDISAMTKDYFICYSTRISLQKHWTQQFYIISKNIQLRKRCHAVCFCLLRKVVDLLLYCNGLWCYSLCTKCFSITYDNYQISVTVCLHKLFKFKAYSLGSYQFCLSNVNDWLSINLLCFKKYI